MSDAITVSCPECETKLRLKDRRAVGKRVKCPKCEVPFLVEIPAAAEEDPLDFLDELEESPRSRSQRADEFDDYEDAPAKPKKKKTAAKKKKKRRRSTDWQQPAMIGGGVLLLLLLLGGGVYLVTGTSISSNPIDMTYLPADADVVVKIDVGDITRARLLTPLMENPTVKEALATATAEVGLGLGDIDSITLGVRSEAGGVNAGFPGMPVGMGGMNPLMGAGNPAESLENGLAVIRLAKPLDPQKLVDGGGVLMQHAGRSLITRPDADGIATLFATESMLLVGPEAAVKSAYDAGPVQVRRPEFDFINPDMHLLFAYAPRDRQVFKNIAAMSPVPEGADKHVMDLTLAMGGGINFNSNADVEIWYSLEDRTAAKMAYRGLESERKQARDGLAQARTMLDQQGAVLAMMAPNLGTSAKKLLDIADQTIDSMSASTSGSYYTMELTVPGSIGPAIQELVASMPDMGGMAMPGAMPGGMPTAAPSSFGPGGVTPSAGSPAGTGFPGGQMPPGAFPGGQPPAAAFPGGQPPAAFPGGQPPGAFPGGQPPAAFPGAPANPAAGPAAGPAGPAFDPLRPAPAAPGVNPGFVPPGANPALAPAVPGRQSR